MRQCPSLPGFSSSYFWDHIHKHKWNWYDFVAFSKLVSSYYSIGSYIKALSLLYIYNAPTINNDIYSDKYTCYFDIYNSPTNIDQKMIPKIIIRFILIGLLLLVIVQNKSLCIGRLT